MNANQQTIPVKAGDTSEIFPINPLVLDAGNTLIQQVSVRNNSTFVVNLYPGAEQPIGTSVDILPNETLTVPMGSIQGGVTYCAVGVTGEAQNNGQIYLYWNDQPPQALSTTNGTVAQQPYPANATPVYNPFNTSISSSPHLLYTVPTGHIYYVTSVWWTINGTLLASSIGFFGLEENASGTFLYGNYLPNFSTSNQLIAIAGTGTNFVVPIEVPGGTNLEIVFSNFSGSVNATGGVNGYVI